MPSVPPRKQNPTPNAGITAVSAAASFAVQDFANVFVMEWVDNAPFPYIND